MKIFISHSSRDKWIARKLSEEISALNCETFLDEKDIETGESIDSKINEHLGECDDFLLLLSPDSIKSHWVLIELGGALALKKRVLVILLYLGSNEIPQPISRYLARDINDVDKYYEEINKRKSGQGKKEQVKTTKKLAHKLEKPLKLGDMVRIISVPQYETTKKVGWCSEMDKFCNTISSITGIVKGDDFGSFAKIKDDGEEWSWDLDWLTKVE